MSQVTIHSLTFHAEQAAITLLVWWKRCQRFLDWAHCVNENSKAESHFTPWPSPLALPLRFARAREGVGVSQFPL